MTNSVKTYEFTAFTEADLAADGNLNCGDKFEMPASATVCFEVKDNDAFLSGDNKKNENANDHSYQTAHITDAATGEELGNGHQIYAEKYWTLHGSDGETYYLIEIEQEGDGQDFFTFYGDVPPAGVELTVQSSDNVKGDWVDFKCLDAGIKFEPDPDGKITIEAESLELSGYKVEHQDAASGDELIKLSCNTGYARLPSFGGESCVYDLEITVIDENDGEGFLDVFVDGEFVGCFQLNQNNNGNGVSDVSFSTLTLKGVEIPQGAEITFKGRADDYEFIRIDKIEFCKVEFRECDDPDAVNIGFDNFVAGEKITDQLDGITISASGGSGDAMIFDSGAAQASGGDSDLLTMKQGNVLIVSEDGDMSDPDDAVGGTICIEFDNPAKVFDLKVVDTEEGGTITAELADGSTVEIEIPSIANGGVAQVLIDLEDVTKLTIELDGSGAIDDLCYVPGAPQLGSLSGRYFCDENGDGLDNDNLNDGVGGILVELLNADGSGTGMTTTTNEFGNYSFTDLVPGTYGVKFTDTTGATDGKALTTTDVDGNANDDIDSDAVGDNVMSTISGIEVVGGQDTPDNDAGVVPLGSVAGRLFCDTDNDDLDNGNGNEPGVGGVTVTLTNVDTGEELTTETAADGSYLFNDLRAGNYKVTFDGNDDDLDGKVFVNQTPGDNDAIGGSDVDPTNGMTEVFPLGVGENKTDVDAGVEADDPGTAALGDTIWLDLFGNGLLDEFEATVDGITVQLKDENGVVIDSQVTSNGGQYLFENLNAGTYSVAVVKPTIGDTVTFVNPDGTTETITLQIGGIEGFELTTPNAGDDDLDSDFDPISMMSEPVTLSEGEVNLSVDGGLLRCGLIEGTSQSDVNAPAAGYDLLIGCETDDTMFGFSGEDTLEGRDGNDRIDGGSFDDLIFGGAGNDFLTGAEGNDVIEGGAGNDFISGNDSGQTDNGFDIAVFDGDLADATITVIDAFNGRLAEVQVTTAAGDTDTLFGIEVLRFDDQDVAVDTIVPGGARDTVAAPAGPGGNVNVDVLANDATASGVINLGTLSVAEVNDGAFGTVVIETDGTVTYTAGADFAGYDFFSYTVTNGTGFVNTVEVQVGELPRPVAGDTGVIVLADAIGDDGVTFTGTDGDDAILGGTGFDSIDAGRGNDVVDGGRGEDFIRGGNQDDILLGGDGQDDIAGNNGNDQMFGEGGEDRLRGSSLNDTIFGGDHDDELQGENGSDFLVGGGGNDEFVDFGDGADIALGGAGADSFEWTENTGGTDLLDGESGIDSLEITLNGADTAAVQAEIDAYLAGISGGSVNGELTATFSFTTLDLEIRNIEDVFIA